MPPGAAMTEVDKLETARGHAGMRGFAVFASAVRFIAVAAAVAAVAAAPAGARSAGIGFMYIPQHVVQGDDARVSVRVQPTGSRCTLNVRYFGGTLQGGIAAATATNGRATWTWHVPADVQAGPAKATVRCSRVGSTTRRLMIVGRLIEPRITVEKSGYSIRPQLGGGSRLSYGLMLHNDSPTKDATSVQIQVNFVMPDNHLLGTDTQQIDGIAAGADFAFGNMVTFPGAAPIARLEVVIRVDAYKPHTLHDATLANIHLVPQLFDSQWLGSIEGELQNTDPTLALQSTRMFAVVFDPAGNIVGGGSGFTFGMLAPGVRQFIKLSSGLDAIPMERAASTRVSMVATWKQPGT